MTSEFFDSFYASGTGYYGLEARPEFQSFLAGLPKGAHCLDLACGQGRHSVLAARAGHRVHAVDYSAVGIEQLRAYATSEGLAIEPERADIREIRPAPGEYDAVFLVSTLSHFTEADLGPLATMSVAALRDGGRAFVEGFTTADPGFVGGGHKSETAAALKHFFAPGTLRDLFGGVEIDVYREFMEDDFSHGPAHEHGVALLIGTKQVQRA